MTKVRYVGMDVHQDSIVLAVAEEGRDAAEVFATVGNDWKSLERQLRRGSRAEVLL